MRAQAGGATAARSAPALRGQRSAPARFQAGLAMVQAVLSQHVALMQRALRRCPDLPQDWRRASNASDYAFVMTAEQVLAFKDKLTGILWEELRRSPPPDAPLASGTRRFMVMLHSFPFPGFDLSDGAEDGG